MQLLHHVMLPARGASAARCTVFLHGILGSGNNLRAMAQAWSQVDPQTDGVLVDLRMHGRSQGFAAPHTVDACARDLVDLAQALPRPVTCVIGHSFGGKVALAFARQSPEVARVSLLDSCPGPRRELDGSEQALAVLAMLERAPRDFEARAVFADYVQAQGFSRAVADWLAMNLERRDGSLHLRLDLQAIRALVDDYLGLDLWPVIESTPARVDLVVAGQSSVFRDADLARADALAAESPGRIHVHRLPAAGHWVHADDLASVLGALTGGTPPAA